MPRGFWKLEDVSDERLVERLKGLLVAEGRTEARVIAHLAELDERRLHLIGGRSLFEYCQKELGLSEGQAFYRITTARTARRFPIVFELLDRRQVHITTITLISKYLTEENHLEILQGVQGKTKREVLELLAQRFPKASVANEIRRLPPRAGATTLGPTGLLEPLNGERYCLQLDIDRQTLEALELARDLMSHANPKGDLSVVVKRAAEVLVEQLQKQRFGRTDRPRSAGRKGVRKSAREDGNEGCSPESAVVEHGHMGQPKCEGVASERGETELVAAANCTARRRRRIGNAVRRELLERDGLRCAFVSESGMRCTGRAFLQVDHELAWSKGGSDEGHNLRILCRAHNLLLAEREFGRRPFKQSG